MALRGVDSLGRGLRQCSRGFRDPIMPKSIAGSDARSTVLIRGLAALVLLGIPGLGVASWWRGRSERFLAEAERLIEQGRADEAAVWLHLPETQPNTRDRALLLRAQAALAKGRPSEAVG